MGEQAEKLNNYISWAFGAWEFTHGMVAPESRERGVELVAGSLASRPDTLEDPMRTMAIAAETARCAFMMAMDMEVETGASFRCLATTVAYVLSAERDVLEARHDECVEAHGLVCCPCSNQDVVTDL